MTFQSKGGGVVVPDLYDTTSYSDQDTGQDFQDEKKVMARRLLDVLDDEWIFKLATAMMTNGLIEYGHMRPEAWDSAFAVADAAHALPERLDLRDPDGVTLKQTTLRERPLTQVREFSEPSISAIEPICTCNNRKPSTKAQIQGPEQEAKEFTTIVVHNLPQGTVQSKAMAWVDHAGFQGTYDFLLWFPPRLSGRNGGAYLFINFLTAAHAKYFQISYRGYTFPDDKAQCEKRGLRIRPANVQGFVANYEKYVHMLNPSVKTNCEPYFAKSSVEKYMAVEQRLAEKTSHACNLATTIIIRHVPRYVDSQDLAMVWLDEVGYRDEYDFCFLVPTLKQASVDTYKIVHMFVNFETHEAAERCINKLNGEVTQQGKPALEVVYSRVQGFNACVRHFQACFEGTKGKPKPWMKTCFADARDHD